MTRYKFEVEVDSDMFYGGMVIDLNNALADLKQRKSIKKVRRVRVIEKV